MQGEAGRRQDAPARIPGRGRTFALTHFRTAVQRTPYSVLRTAVASLYSPALYSSRLGVPVGFPVITPEVALFLIQLSTVDDAASP